VIVVLCLRLSTLERLFHRYFRQVTSHQLDMINLQDDPREHGNCFSAYGQQLQLSHDSILRSPLPRNEVEQLDGVAMGFQLATMPRSNSAYYRGRTPVKVCGLGTVAAPIYVKQPCSARPSCVWPTRVASPRII
jgi:hypothetical protein